MFKKTLIIGLGLIGGSFAKALRKNNLSQEIFACDFDEESLSLAYEEKIIDGERALDGGLENFDLIVVATPLSAYKEIFGKLASFASKQALVIDLGSVKNFEFKIFPKNFVPCHPIAGLEKSGFASALENLFVGKKFFICPENCDQSLVEKVTNLAKKIGAIPEKIDAKKHDEVFALVSHLPQFLSFLTKEFSPKKIDDSFFKTAFRLDNSSPEIWSDIFQFNQKNLEKFYLKFFDQLEKNFEDLAQFKSTNDECNFSEKFFNENFAAIFFRFLVVKSYLEIPDLKQAQSFAGSGFTDFTSIKKITALPQQKMLELIKNNEIKIKKFFTEIS